MKRIRCLTVLCLISVLGAGQPRHFGTSSQSTWDRIQEIQGSMEWAQRISGLAASHSLIITDPVEDFADALNTDESTYRNLDEFFQAMELVKQAAIRDAIDRLLLQDELDNSTLSEDERAFWEDLRSAIDLSGHALGHSVGDPHFSTFDGYQYDLQTVGEFILCRSAKRRFEVQVRQSKYRGNTAINSAVAMNLHGQHISFYSADPPGDSTTGPLYINGKSYRIKNNYTVFRTGGAIQRISDHYFIVIWETGEKVSLNLHKAIDIVVSIPADKNTGTEGLMGNNNKDKSDDLKTADGKLVTPKNWNKDLPPVINSKVHANQQMIDAEKIYNNLLASQFSDSWRIKSENSLFAYPAGYTTSNFTDHDFPSQYNSISSLRPEQIEAAKKTCRKNGVPETQLEACIYDLSFTGEEIFTQSGIFLKETSELLAKWGIPTTLKEKAEILIQPKKKINSQLKKKLRF